MQTLKNTFEKTAVGGRNKRIWSGFLKVLENNPLQLDGETQKESAERITLKLIEIVDDDLTGTLLGVHHLFGPRHLVACVTHGS